MKRVGSTAPTNILRVMALRMAGYSIGKDVWIGGGLVIVDDNRGNERLSIGDRVAIAPGATIILQSYPNKSRLRNIVPTCQGDVVIEDDAWVGAGAIILPDITIGAASVIGAGAVVTKNVAKETVVVGVPATYLRSIIEELEKEIDSLDPIDISDQKLLADLDGGADSRV